MSETTSLHNFFILSSGGRAIPLRFRFRHSLEKFVIGFGVGELFDLLEFQASISVGNDVSNPDHFTVHLHPD